MKKMTAMVLVAAALLPSCAGSRARQNVLLPAMRLAWGSISPDVERGLTEAVAGGTLTQVQATQFLAQRDEFEDKLREDEPERNLQLTWLALRPWAEAGIGERESAGEVGAGVAASLRERVANFDDAVRRYDGGEQ